MRRTITLVALPIVAALVAFLGYRLAPHLVQPRVAAAQPSASDFFGEGPRPRASVSRTAPRPTAASKTPAATKSPTTPTTLSTSTPPAASRTTSRSRTCSAANAADIPIPAAGATVFSRITIAGCGGQASHRATVTVAVVFPYRGLLTITLRAPDGTVASLYDGLLGDASEDVRETFTVDLSASAADGEWTLFVDNGWSEQDGLIDEWRLSVG